VCRSKDSFCQLTGISRLSKRGSIERCSDVQPSILEPHQSNISARSASHEDRTFLNRVGVAGENRLSTVHRVGMDTNDKWWVCGERLASQSIRDNDNSGFDGRQTSGLDQLYIHVRWGVIGDGGLRSVQEHGPNFQGALHQGSIQEFPGDGVARWESTFGLTGTTTQAPPSERPSPTLHRQFPQTDPGQSVERGTVETAAADF
jgi:hypothetical protein